MNIDNPSVKHIPQLKELWKDAFDDTDKTIDTFFEIAFSPNRCLCTFEGDKVVSVLYWFDCTLEDKSIAYIYAVATDEDYRGRGLCSNLMKYTHRHLADNDYCGAVLVPGSRELFEFYGRMGYKNCSGISVVNETVGESNTEIRLLTASEYEKLRKEFLPKHSVLQEGINSLYFSAEYDFYGGESFVFASKKTGDKLYSPEYLGDADSIPDVLKSLGCNEGTFRIPGNERDFAMWISFNSSVKPPKYFGLAFD